MIIFCSDVHLHTPADRENTFFQFLNTVPSTTEAIFILGDLFEYWWNDDHGDKIYESWETYFQTYPLPLYFLKGNRDFLCSKKFFKKTNIQLLSSGSILFAYDKKISLYHGDEPGLLDVKYQIARKVLRSELIQALYYQLPKRIQLKLAQKARKSSHPPSVLKINYMKWIGEDHKIDAIIHGHLHVARYQKVTSTDIYQLGTWDSEKGSWLSLDETGFKFHSFSMENITHHAIK